MCFSAACVATTCADLMSITRTALRWSPRTSWEWPCRRCHKDIEPAEGADAFSTEPWTASASAASRLESRLPFRRCVQSALTTDEAAFHPGVVMATLAHPRRAFSAPALPLPIFLPFSSLSGRLTEMDARRFWADAKVAAEERVSPSPNTKDGNAASSVVKAMNAAAERHSRSKRTRQTPKAARASRERSTPSAGSMSCEQRRHGHPRRSRKTTLEELDRVIDINVRGTLVATQAALKHMRAAGRIIMSRLVRGASVSCARAGAVSATKGPSKCFSGVVQRGGKPGITVNNVQLGPIARI